MPDFITRKRNDLQIPLMKKKKFKFYRESERKEKMFLEMNFFSSISFANAKGFKSKKIPSFHKNFV